MRWAPFRIVDNWPAAGKPFVSHGHAGGRFPAMVRVSPAARDAYEQLVRSTVLPVDTIVAEYLADPGSDRTRAVYVMQKTTAERWRFLVITPTGLVDERAPTALCARCHAEAPADQLFGLPRD